MVFIVPSVLLSHRGQTTNWFRTVGVNTERIEDVTARDPKVLRRIIKMRTHFRLVRRFYSFGFVNYRKFHDGENEIYSHCYTGAVWYNGGRLDCQR